VGVDGVRVATGRFFGPIFQDERGELWCLQKAERANEWGWKVWVWRMVKQVCGDGWQKCEMCVPNWRFLVPHTDP
jgi:hypothetical protein